MPHIRPSVARTASREADLAVARRVAVVPAPDPQVDPAQAGRLAREQHLVLKSRQQELLEFVEVGRAVDDHLQRAGVQRLERAVLEQRGGNEFAPAVGDLRQLRLALLDGVLEERDQLGAELGRGQMIHALNVLEAVEVDLVSVARGHYRLSPMSQTLTPTLSRSTGRGREFTHARCVYCRFTGMITYRKFGPPFKRPGRLGAVISMVISSASTTRRASVRNCGLKPISTSGPSNLAGKFTVASPDSGLRLVSTRPFLLKCRRTPFDSSV